MTSDPNVLPTNALSLEDHGIVVVLSFESKPAALEFDRNLVEILKNDPQLRDTLGTVFFGGEPGGSTRAMEFPKGASMEQACDAYRRLSAAAVGIVDGTFVDRTDGA